MSADVEENDAHLKKVIIKGPIETLCGSASFFLCALSVVYRGQGLFFSFFLLFVVSGGCGKYCRWGKRQPPPLPVCKKFLLLPFPPSLSIFLSLSLSLCYSLSMETLLFFLLSACHPAGLWTEIGERKRVSEKDRQRAMSHKKMRERDKEADFEQSFRQRDLTIQTPSWNVIQSQVHIQVCSFEKNADFITNKIKTSSFDRNKCALIRNVWSVNT